MSVSMTCVSFRWQLQCAFDLKSLISLAMFLTARKVWGFLVSVHQDL
jgi:hypothetical protein